MRLMYDSVNAAAIPADAEIIAGYVDGPRSQWSEADWARFPNAIKVRIAVFSWDDGDVLDVEQFDATPAECPDWIRRQQARGLAVPTIYCNGASLAEVQRYCEGLTYDIWLADPTGIPHNDHAATQFAWHGPNGENYDMSLCADWWPRVEDQSQEPTVDDFRQALSYLNNDVIAPLGSYKYPRIKAAVAEVARVAEQYGA